MLRIMLLYLYDYSLWIYLMNFPIFVRASSLELGLELLAKPVLIKCLCRFCMYAAKYEYPV